MIIKGLDAINEHAKTFVDAREEELHRKIAEYREQVSRVDFEGGEHFSTFAVERGDDDFEMVYLVHLDANCELIAVLGTDPQSSYEVWEDVSWYCEQNGIDEDALRASHRAHHDRFADAWRKQFPEEAAAMDKAGW